VPIGKDGAVGDDADGAIECISAVTLEVADMARAVAFYEALGFRRCDGGPEAAFTSFAVGSQYVNLQLDLSYRPSRRWGRVIFWVHDVDACFARALRAGLRPEAPPADAPWGERYFHLVDPDGHELSFARPLPSRVR
jgi:catechol 2,3-dioxygenase-like lactoylglutathione lyase family enzyme